MLNFFVLFRAFYDMQKHMISTSTISCKAITGLPVYTTKYSRITICKQNGKIEIYVCIKHYF